jgi:hypothetical protein
MTGEVGPSCFRILLSRLPGDALIEFVVGRRLGLGVELVPPGVLHLPQGRATGRHQARRRCRLAQMGKMSRTVTASVMKAIIRISPPHLGHASGNTS